MWCAAVCLAIAALLVAAQAWLRTQAKIDSLQTQLTAARAEAPPATPVTVEVSDFARSLGVAPPASQVVREVQRASAEAAVHLVTFRAQEHVPSPEQLGRLELVVTLRGSYAGSKQVLKQVAERFANLTVQRLRMRRGASPTEVETELTLSLWSAPVAAATQGR